VDVIGSQRDHRADERADADVKSCGPGIPVLMPNLRCDERAGDGGKNAGPRGEHV